MARRTMDIYSATRDANSYSYGALIRSGISEADAIALRRISMTLHAWHEMECGTDRGAYERDEVTGKVHYYNAMTGKRSTYTVPDRETGALKRLDGIMKRYPDLKAYVQGDPRGASLYIIRPSDIREGGAIDANYSRGIAVYK